MRDDSAYLGLIAVALAAAHLAFARVVWHHAPAKERDARPGVLALGVALTCFALAVPIQLSGFAVHMAWALQGAGLVWLAARYCSDKLGAAGSLLLVLAVVSLAVDSDELRNVELATLANVRFLSFAVLAASTFAAARWFADRPRAAISYVTAHALVLTGVGLELAGWIARAYPDSRFETTTVAISIWMALYAVGLVSLGVVRHAVIDRVLGLGLLGLVIVKLYLSDVWELGRAFRIAAFLGLGVLLLLVSYLYSRYRGSIEKLWKRDGDSDGDGAATGT